LLTKIFSTHGVTDIRQLPTSGLSKDVINAGRNVITSNLIPPGKIINFGMVINFGFVRKDN
jgi:hypothetical protein